MSKVTNPAFTDKCPLCDKVIGAISERGLKQGMGVHKRMAHGIKGRQGHYGAALAERAKKAIEARWAGHVKQSPEEVRARARAHYYAKKAQRTQASITAASNGVAVPTKQASDAVACKLSECPCCGTRFYMVRGQ